MTAPKGRTYDCTVRGGGFVAERSCPQGRSTYGLTPRAHSSGGKERLGRISKMGNPTLRTLLILGATTVLRHARNGGKASPWLQAILSRRPPKVAAVALANKTARIVWALLTKGSHYRNPGLAASSTMGA